MTPSATIAVVWDGSAFQRVDAIPVNDRGFRYGMAFFESLAIRGGQIEHLAAHLQRLREAATEAGWPVGEAAWAAVAPMLESLFLPGPVFARLYLTAGDGGPLDPVTVPRLIAIGQPREDGEASAVALHPISTPYAPLPGGYKTANYWANIRALAEAKAAGADEAILFNPKGEIVSAAMANLFLKIDGEWFTPPVSTGARRGIVREGLRELGSEAILHADALDRAESALITSSWAGIVPVRRLGNRELALCPAALELQHCFRHG